MKKIITVSIASGLMGLSLLISPLFAEDKVIATVNGTTITQEKLDSLVKVIQRIPQGQASGQNSTRIALDELIMAELIRQEAKKSGIAEKAEVKKQIQEVADNIILRAWSKEKLKSFTISDEEYQKEYDERMGKQPKKEYKARHILVKTEDEAKAILKELEDGAKFEEVAKKKSTDKGSGMRGGDLNWVKPNSVVPPFAEALAKLKKGETTKIAVKTQFGFHVIKLEDIRDLKLPNLATVKPQLKRIIEQKKMQAYVKTLREKADIKVTLPEKPATIPPVTTPKSETAPTNPAEKK